METEPELMFWSLFGGILQGRELVGILDGQRVGDDSLAESFCCGEVGCLGFGFLVCWVGILLILSQRKTLLPRTS